MGRMMSVIYPMEFIVQPKITDRVMWSVCSVRDVWNVTRSA